MYQPRPYKSIRIYPNGDNGIRAEIWRPGRKPRYYPRYNSRLSEASEARLCRLLMDNDPLIEMGPDGLEIFTHWEIE